MTFDEEEIKKLVKMREQEEQALRDFKAKYKTNAETIGGIYDSGKDQVSIHFLKQVGFDGSQLKGRILNQESPLFSKAEFDNFICGDFACIHQGDGFKIVKINFEAEYEQLQDIEKLHDEKESIESTLWAYRFDSEMRDADFAKIYEQKKEEIDIAIIHSLSSVMVIENTFKRTQLYVESLKNKLERKR